MTVPDSPFPSVRVGPVPIALADPDDVLDVIARWIEQGDSASCHIVNHLAAHPTVEARGDADLAAVLERADCNVADGMGSVWAARLLSGDDRPRARVYGPDMMLAVIERGLPRGWRHAFVGGTEAVLPALLERLQDRYPELQVAGAHAPPFRAIDTAAVDDDLGHLRLDQPADVIWVGLGVPKQLLWADIARTRRPARVIVTVGAAFDFHAGAVRQAPGWMQDRGLEWLHRLSQNPRRLFRRYAVGNARHVVGVSGDWWRTRHQRRAN